MTLFWEERYETPDCKPLERRERPGSYRIRVVVGSGHLGSPCRDCSRRGAARCVWRVALLVSRSSRSCGNKSDAAGRNVVESGERPRPYGIRTVVGFSYVFRSIGDEFFGCWYRRSLQQGCGLVACGNLTLGPAVVFPVAPKDRIFRANELGRV